MKNNFYLRLCKYFIIVFCLLQQLHAAGQLKLISATTRMPNGFGSIYTVASGATNISSMVKIEGTSSGYPSRGQLVLGSNGKFYGTARVGGAGTRGVIFEYDIAKGRISDKVAMLAETGGNPEGSLTAVSPGILIGHASYGGLNMAGVIFEYNYLTDTYTKKIDLIATDGADPFSDLVRASNGKFYGITAEGGANNVGVIYEYDYNANTYTKKIDLTIAGGYNSAYSMVEAPNGKFYGTADKGGANNMGVIFEYDFINNIYTPKVDMISATGSYPEGALFLAPNGKFYGTTRGGSTGGRGVIYEYDYATNIYTKKFDLAIPSNGQKPRGPLALAPNGKLYGATYEGGANGDGIVFEYDYTNNAFAKKADLLAVNGQGAICGLSLAPNGKLYGTTYFGGYINYGVIFEFDPATGIYNKKVDFDIANFGYEPFGNPLLASNGKIYFITYQGGLDGYGSVIEYDPYTNEYVHGADLTYPDGTRVLGGLTEGNPGKLYGLTAYGGATDEGSLFEYDCATHTITKKKDLGGIDGGGVEVFSTMLKASNGKIYGTLQRGGLFGLGVLFEYDYNTNTYTKKIDFSDALGRHPGHSLIEASNGKIYGGTSMADVNQAGTLFEYNYNTNVLTAKIILNPLEGASPLGPMVEANGKLYGACWYGGANDKGVIYEWDYNNTNAYLKKIDLQQSTGAHGVGLMKSQNGKFYGIANGGGTYDQGTLFEYDYITNTYTQKIAFNQAAATNNGYWPRGIPVEIDFGVVPVTLFDFKATRSGANALLTWKTSNEINCNYIDIERSPDGRNFSFINSVNANGNSSAVNSYNYTDDKVLLSKNYYRLKIVSNEGKIKYSDTRTVQFNKEDAVLVYPNPLRDQLNLSFAGGWLNQPVKISLYNQLGQQLWLKQIDHVKQTENFYTGKVMPGTYTIKLEQLQSGNILYKRVQVIN